MKIKSKIGIRIEESGFKDRYIATKVGGVSQKTVYNWRKGLSYPTFEKSFILARILGCKVDDLAELEEEDVNGDTK
jgi:transcriptional regulator with XRE-family HTH domain